jgi:hypothetical protein
MTSGALLLGAAAALTSPAATASPPGRSGEAVLALPTPKEFVSGLDLECFKTPGEPLDVRVTLSHLNRVLVGLGLPAHDVIVRELEQTCVPVMKNGVPPAASAEPFVSHVDLACYRVEAEPLAQPVGINLAHLNPVLQGLPRHDVRMVVPQQLCVPMGKNGVLPSREVFDVARYVDLECWQVEAGFHPAFRVKLTQLNRQLAGIPEHILTLVEQPRQLCVPVRKDHQDIPPATLDIVQWIDLEKFAASPPVVIPPKAVSLDHWNPLFVTLPRPQVVLETAEALMVPVAKNGAFPP